MMPSLNGFPKGISRMSSSNQSVLEKLFNLNANQTNVRTEIMAGVTTFLAMCYIIIVNPLILGETGMDMGAVFVATCIASAIGCFVMGFVGNYPIALAPGMGLNAYFTFAVVKGMGVDWRVALGAVFISGIIFILFSFFKVREMLVNALPMGLKMSIAPPPRRMSGAFYMPVVSVGLAAELG